MTSDSRQRPRSPLLIACLLASVTVLVGIRYNSRTAGGSDSYAYLSQAELWLHGPLITPLPDAGRAPWPNAARTFMPLGFAPAANPSEMASLVPVGLPLLMAGAQLIAGHCAMFWVVPGCGGLLVLLTFCIGRRVGSDQAGLAAAWLLATSPVTLAMLMPPMSDIPAAMCWALVTYWVFVDSTVSVAAAGLAASLAIVIRPNLAPLVGAFALWLGGRELFGAARPSRRFLRTALFVAGVVPGCIAVALVNNAWYGSPTATGFGGADVLFSVSHIPANLKNYGTWLVGTETPLALAGLLALVVPLAQIWRTRDSQHKAWLLALVTVTVIAFYAVYLPFDAWWYLRFLLPAWPAIFVASALVWSRLFDRTRPWVRAAGIVLIVAAGLNGVRIARDRDMFSVRRGESKFSAVARLVEASTDPASIVLAGMHSGSLRYYGARTTLHYDFLDPDWLDRAAAWLAQQGAHPYLLVDDWERAAFRRQFEATNRLGRLDSRPVFVYDGGAKVYLFDLLAEPDPNREPAPMRDGGEPDPCPRPHPAPAFTIGRR